MIERLKIYVYILVITKGYGVRATTIGGPNAFAFLSLRMLATYMRRIRNYNLEIRIAGSSCPRNY